MAATYYVSALPLLEHTADLFQLTYPTGLQACSLSGTSPFKLHYLSFNSRLSHCCPFANRLDVPLSRYLWRLHYPVHPHPGAGSGVNCTDEKFSDADTESAASCLSDSTASPTRPRRVVAASIVNVRSSSEKLTLHYRASVNAGMIIPHTAFFVRSKPSPWTTMRSSHRCLFDMGPVTKIELAVLSDNEDTLPDLAEVKHSVETL